MQYSEIMVRYGELSTKGKNRMRFINKLKRNIQAVLSVYPQVHVKADRDRTHVYLHGTDYQPVAESLKQIFGIQNFSPSYKIEKSVPALIEAVQTIMKQVYQEGMTFKITSKRSDHSFELDSRELNQTLGDAVFMAIPNVQVRLILSFVSRSVKKQPISLTRRFVVLEACQSGLQEKECLCCQVGLTHQWLVIWLSSAV